MRSFVLSAAIVCAFGLPAAAEDVPVPAAAPTMLHDMMVPPRSFTIFFEHAGPQIPEDAQSLLPQVAEIYARVGYTAVAIECHSDNVASQAINVPLTEDRARRIKTELVRYGVPEAAIAAAGLGYSEPLAADAAMDTAISNRRCVIALT